MKSAMKSGLRTMLAGLVVFLASTAAHAQATRTWVSGVGDDANPCSRTAPCKTFAGAISKTATGGVISVLDPGGFGGLTITKSITVDGGAVEGSALVAGAGVNGFVINAPADATVTLRNLSIYGVGSAQNGVRVIAGGTVHVENCIINGFRATNGLGISFQPSATTRLFVRDSTINANGSTTGGGGILVQPTGVGIGILTVENSRISGNMGFGVRAQNNGFVTIGNSQIEGNKKSGVSAFSVAGGLVDIVVHNSVLNDNGFDVPANEASVLSTGANAFVHLSQTVVSDNEQGLRRVSTGNILSFGDNKAVSNTVDGTPNGVVEPQF